MPFRLLLALILSLAAIPRVTSAAEEAPAALPAVQVNESPLDRVGVVFTASFTLFRRKATDMTVVRVRPNSPAAKAGLKPDDAILTFQGKPIVGLNEKEIRALLMAPAGSEVTMTIRSTETEAPRTLILKLPDRPLNQPKPDSQPAAAIESK